MEYQTFLESKKYTIKATGYQVVDSDIHPKLYDFQKAIVKWACRKGRAAVFADCGLGKTFIQLEWARLIGGQCLIVAPLCVAKQTIEEAMRINIPIDFVRSQSDIGPGINITNYEMVDKFKPDFNSIVLDESSILKSLAGKTRRKLIKIFKKVPYKLCCTATPCPNDIAELGNHAEFLDIMTHAEMLASFFVNKADKGQGWVMKGYARDPFYKWLASWAVCLTNPEDLGFDGSLFNLPELNINHIEIKSDYKRDDELFFTGLKGIQDRAAIRKATVNDRVQVIADLIQNSNGSQWVLWCGLNDEQNKAVKALEAYDISVSSVYGNLTIDEKAKRIWSWLNGETSVLVSKPKVCGFGMNFQNASNMAFVGLSDSYESYYQCMRRLWRFGQTKQVNAHIVLTDIEHGIYENVKRKEKQARKLSKELVKNIEEFERIEIRETENGGTEYKENIFTGDKWTLWQGDSVEIIKKLADDSIDLSVYSPPFISLYTYSASERDIGNSRNDKTFWLHYSYLIADLLRITKPGRVTAVHLSQVPAMLIRDGYIGLKDLRGQAVEEYQKRGWIYDGEIVIQKNPQAQAVRTKSKALLFVQMKRDSTWLRPGLADYILKFRKPGENKVPVKPKDISNDDWIRWAHPVWIDIRENHTLNKAEARGDKDEMHIAPLQLDVIDRCVRLWSNPGEVVFSPFSGIGSEGYQAIKRGRHFLGCELKPEYVKVAIKNLNKAEHEVDQPTLFKMED